MSGKRLFSRIDVALPVRVYCQGEHLTGMVHDISLNGVLVAFPEQTQLPNHCHNRTVTADILSDPEHKTLVSLEGHVVRADASHLAICWDEIELDTLSELRSLLEYNGITDKQMARQFETLVAQHKL